MTSQNHPTMVRVILSEPKKQELDFMIEMGISDAPSLMCEVMSNTECRAKRKVAFREKLFFPLRKLAEKMWQYADFEHFQIGEILIDWRGRDVPLFEEKMNCEIKKEKMKFGFTVKVTIQECEKKHHQNSFKRSQMLQGHIRNISKAMSYSCPFTLVKIDMVLLKMIEKYDTISRWVYFKDYEQELIEGIVPNTPNTTSTTSGVEN